MPRSPTAFDALLTPPHPASTPPHTSRARTRTHTQLTLVSDREHQLAKEALARGDKDKARTALRRRKYQESLLSKTDGQLETLEGLVRLPFHLLAVS